MVFMVIFMVLDPRCISSRRARKGARSARSADNPPRCSHRINFIEKRVGVATGQFIRAQRLCSILPTFKQAIQYICLNGIGRGYHRRALDRTWGRFLAKWWKAKEARAWFRRMTRVVIKQIREEIGQKPSTKRRKTKGSKQENVGLYWIAGTGITHALLII